MKKIIKFIKKYCEPVMFTYLLIAPIISILMLVIDLLGVILLSWWIIIAPIVLGVLISGMVIYLYVFSIVLDRIKEQFDCYFTKVWEK